MRALSGNMAPLLGRATEVQVLTGLLDDVERTGAALVLRGDPGIGKSRLLSEAIALAERREMNILMARGVQSEARLSFGGLQQLLRPLRAEASRLPAVQQALLEAAVGAGGDEQPERYRIALAVLDLLSEAATDRPLLLVAEDAHWLDQASLEVLAFVGRRLESDPIVLLAAARVGYPTVFSAGELPELRLEPLDPQSAMQLLEETGRHMTAADRRRILRNAAGNPLALFELPSLANAGDHAVPGLIPLTERLERTFAARAADLPPDTQLLLLVAALNDSDSLEEVLDAGRRVTGEIVAVEVLQPAAEAMVVDLDERTVHFRHPLMRSAVRQSAPVEQRRRVHAALAATLDAVPDRRVWHRAALMSGAHEDIASELEEASRRARQRGANDVALTALRRAGELSEPATASGRLLGAAALAAELGRRDIVALVLQDVERLEPGPLERARITWIEEMVTTRPLGDAARFAELTAVAEEAGRAGDHELHVDLLWLVASRSWWVDPGSAARRVLIEAADRLGGADAADPRVFAVHAYADPFGHAPGVLARLRATAHDRRADTEVARQYGPAALVVGEFDLGADFLGTAVGALRDEGRLRHLPRLLMLYANTAARLADWDVAIPAAAEARSLAEEFGDRQMVAAADTAVSLVAGMRGNDLAAEEAAVRAERVAVPAGANITVAFAQFGRVVAALGSGRHAEAYASAERLFDPIDSAYHPVICSWLIGDLAEAALHIDQVEDGRARLRQVEAAAGYSPGSWITLSLAHARVLLAEDPEAEGLYEAALHADLARWPFVRARMLLSYGEWLRRQRRIGDSREPLRTARDIFDSLGCTRWGERTRRELRASGESSRRQDPLARDQLTAQELQIAQLAAKGLSNREIGNRLYVSHRTVGTHLYRIYPKLGVTSRSELDSVLWADHTRQRHQAHQTAR